MIFDVADRAIRDMNRANLRAFSRLKLAKWDELTVIRMVGGVYDMSAALARRYYREVAREAYARAMREAGIKAAQAQAEAMRAINDGWVYDLLSITNPLTLYVFTKETERKKQRLIEAVAAAHDKSAEIDKALRLWTFQVGQYVDIFVAAGRMKAFEDAGVEFVTWVTQKDERVCEECGPLDGKTFRLSDAPDCPLHYRCRCYLIVRMKT